MNTDFLLFFLMVGFDDYGDPDVKRVVDEIGGCRVEILGGHHPKAVVVKGKQHEHKGRRF